MNKMDSSIRKVVKTLLKIFYLDDRQELVISLEQFVKFGIVGATNTILSYAINVFVLKFLQTYSLSWDYVAANGIAFVISVAWSFYWNNKYVFIAREEQRRKPCLTLLKAYISYGFTGIILTNILSWVWIDLLGISRYFAPLINLVISIPLNFIINKLWAFRTK